ncbi:hypothetical protein Ahy_A07g031564 [Arachis hypogaea]|uniref:PB1-like domain-containing protein n=1 Tax=Arachis hypogaea TaxID=3818 RepID=A0A445C489_ARAHY|nr:hypothetical protein Ahy_A07g031564 [Arachis hypogaea]
MTEQKMVYINMRVHYGSAFGYEDGVFKYLKGQSTIIEDIDSDHWFVFEAYEELRQLGYLQANIEALWCKDPSLDDSKTNLKMLKGDADAIKMCNIAELRGLVELFVVHDVGDAKPFLEVGYIDVGRVAENGTDAGIELVVFEGHGTEVAEGSGEPNKGTEGGGEFRVDGNGTSDEDSEDPKYLLSDGGDNTCDIHITDSEEEYEYDSGFDEDNFVPKEDTAVKGKGVGISQFSDKDRVDSDELEVDHMIGGDDGEDDDVEDDADDTSDRRGQKFPVHKPLKDISSYRWEEVADERATCPHAISYINFKGLDLESFVDDHYKKDTYLRCYQEVIHPLNGPYLWERSQYDDVMPPPYRKPSHRPVKKRK